MNIVLCSVPFYQGDAMIKNTTRNQKLGWVLFLLYLAFLTYFMFFADSFGRTERSQTEYAYNLVLFREIRRFYVYRHVVGIKAFLINIIGNVVGFMPFGFFLPVVSRRGRRWYNTVLLSFTLSLCIEVTQLVFKVGSFDVDDLFLNTLGGMIGYIAYRLVQRIRRKLYAKK